MDPKDIPVRLREKLARYRVYSLSGYEISPQEAESRRTGGDLEQIFFSGKGRLVHKWIDYLPVYERLFSQYRNRPITMLEIGVSKGGSLDMWRRYFGDKARLIGIDIDEACATRFDPPNLVEIGSQDDPEFLNRIAQEAGPFDIVLDDGSHVARHQMISFRTLWPKVKPGGLYVIEDLHTAYWPRYGGGLRRSGTAIEIAKTLIDDMHAWFHPHGETYVDKSELGAVLAFESIVAIEKVAKHRPAHVQIPQKNA